MTIDAYAEIGVDLKIIRITCEEKESVTIDDFSTIVCRDHSLILATLSTIAPRNSVYLCCLSSSLATAKRVSMSEVRFIVRELCRDITQERFAIMTLSDLA